MENFKRSTAKIYWMNTRPLFPLIPFTSGLLCFIFHGEDGWFNHFKYFENDKSYVNFALLILQDVTFFFGILSTFLVPADFACKKIIPKNGLHWEIKSPSHIQPPVLTLLCYSGVIRVKKFVLKHWIFFEDISNFNQWKLLIKDEKCWMLRNALLRETIILLPKW